MSWSLIRLAVEMKIEEAESANVGRRPPDLLGDLELVAEHSRWQAAVVRPANLAPGGRSQAHPTAVASFHWPSSKPSFSQPATSVVAAAPVCVGRDQKRLALVEFDLEKADQARGVFVGPDVG